MNTELIGTPGNIWDKNGYPIYPGDLLKVFSFVGPRKKRFFLYLSVAWEEGFAVMTVYTPTDHKKIGEPIRRQCLICSIGNLTKDGVLSEAEIVQGYGPSEKEIDYLDRKRKKIN